MHFPSLSRRVLLASSRHRHVLILAGSPSSIACLRKVYLSATIIMAALVAAMTVVVPLAHLLHYLAPLPTAQAFVASPTSTSVHHAHVHVPTRCATDYYPRPYCCCCSLHVPNHLFSHQLSAHATSSTATCINTGGACRPARTFLDDLSSRFQGDFDNYDQVLADRTAHRPPLTPREGGGHEHIHCTLVPVDDVAVPSSPAAAAMRPYVREGAQLVRLAAFYFDGLPERIFRFRLYALWDATTSTSCSTTSAGTGPAGSGSGGDDENDDEDDNTMAADDGRDDEQDQGERVGMTLYSLSPEVEGMLRGLSGRPLEWVPALLRYLQSASSDADVGADSDFRPFLELDGCDVEWRPDPDPDRHAYAYADADACGSSSAPPPSSSSPARHLPPDEAHHAVMVNGEATIPSLMNPGSMIRVVDELSLWEDDFWINDRGFDPDTGDFVYGNQRGVPYKMRRVSSLIHPSAFEEGDEDGGKSESPLNLQRRIDNEALAWTLGDEYRTTEEYTAAMEAIGGISAKMNARPPAASSPSKGC